MPIDASQQGLDFKLDQPFHQKCSEWIGLRDTPLNLFRLTFLFNHCHASLRRRIFYANCLPHFSRLNLLLIVASYHTAAPLLPLRHCCCEVRVNTVLLALYGPLFQMVSRGGLQATTTCNAAAEIAGLVCYLFVFAQLVASLIYNSLHCHKSLEVK